MTVDVVIAEDVWGPAFDELAARRHVRYVPDAWSDHESLCRAVADTRALVVRNRTQVTADLLDAAPHLRVVARAGVGTDNIDVTAADRRDVAVVVPRGANAISVAEHTLGLALALTRRTVEFDGQVRSGRWTRTPGRELAGRVWGTLSAGATARQTLTLASALGMWTVAYDPYIAVDDPQLADIGCALLPLETVLAEADVLSVHLPATRDTEKLLDAARLSLLPEHALLINVGRGEVIDEEALADALENGHLAGAALDVRASEPPTPGRLETLPTLIQTPHIAGITTDSQQRIVARLSADIDTVLSGGTATNALPRSADPAGRPS